jgi:hypothetical protein
MLETRQLLTGTLPAGEKIVNFTKKLTANLTGIVSFAALSIKDLRPNLTISQAILILLID